MRVPPAPATWASIPSWEWHRAGVEAVRARTIAAAARVASRIEETARLTSADADRRLQALPGIGPWTSAEVRQRACGDADAVSVGDYHLPSIVGWALAGRAVDDAEMLALLAPYPGHRHRASVLAGLSGSHPPRRGPRMSCATTGPSSGQPGGIDGAAACGPGSSASTWAAEPGPLDAITDVTGVRVGQMTVRDGAGIRTGVTAIVPDEVDRAGGAAAGWPVRRQRVRQADRCHPAGRAGSSRRLSC